MVSVNPRSALIASLWVLTSVLIIVGGYTLNFIKLIGMSADGQEGEFVLRLLGVFIPPLGSIMGVFVW